MGQQGQVLAGNVCLVTVFNRADDLPGRCQWVGKFSGVLLWYIRTVVLTIKSTVSVVPLSFSIMAFPS